MQKAIENYIDIQVKKDVSLFDIEKEIIKVERAEIQKARQKQLKQWRKLNNAK